MPLGQTITVVNRSGKVVKNVRTCFSCKEQLLTAYRANSSSISSKRHNQHTVSERQKSKLYARPTLMRRSQGSRPRTIAPMTMYRHAHRLAIRDVRLVLGPFEHGRQSSAAIPTAFGQTTSLDRHKHALLTWASRKSMKAFEDENSYEEIRTVSLA